MKQNSDPVIIKSYKNGIKLKLNEDSSLDEIKEDLKEKITKSAKFYNDAMLGLSFEGKIISDDDRIALADIIEEVSSAKIVSVECEDENEYESFDLMMQRAKAMASKNMAEVYVGNIRSGQVVKTDRSIVIIGDVHTGGFVYAGYSIIVMGALLGSAKAGLNDDATESFVCAVRMHPFELAIDGVGLKETQRDIMDTVKRGKPDPVISYVANGEIAIDNLFNN